LLLLLHQLLYIGVLGDCEYFHALELHTHICQVELQSCYLGLLCAALVIQLLFVFIKCKHIFAYFFMGCAYCSQLDLQVLTFGLVVEFLHSGVFIRHELCGELFPHTFQVLLLVNVGSL
jgi:hypothetical protein